jgi:hypothetical protein
MAKPSEVGGFDLTLPPSTLGLAPIGPLPPEGEGRNGQSAFPGSTSFASNRGLGERQVLNGFSRTLAW